MMMRDFEMEYVNNVDSTGVTVPGGSHSTKNNSSSIVYLVNNQFRLPFGGMCKPPNLQRKLKKVANHQVKRQVSARRASTIPTTMVSLVQAVAQAFDLSSEACLFASDDPDEACADSGDTDVMLPDFNAFISYRTCTNRCTIPGNETPLPILGDSTAKFSLNDKLSLIRNCLQVPGLRSPLYSLCKHKDTPGCGTFSFYDAGSYIIFPDFALRIDISVDKLVSYESIGQTSCAQLDYAQLRANRSTSDKYQEPHTSTITQDEDDISVATEATESCSESNNESATDAKAPDEDAVSDEEPQTEAELIATTKVPLTPSMLCKLHANLANISAVRPSNTAAACEKRTTFDTLKLH